MRVVKKVIPMTVSLDGLGDGDGYVEVVLQVRRAFDADWRYWLDGRVVTGENGSLGLFGVGRRFGDQNDGTGLKLLSPWYFTIAIMPIQILV